MSEYHANDDECDHTQKDCTGQTFESDIYVEHYRCLKCGATGDLTYLTSGDFNWVS